MEMLNMKAGKTGASASTPKNILFGAGTIHKGLKYTDSAWNFEESIIGATQGGSKVSIKPEFKRIEVDGAMVAVKGLQVKIGETATMEINFVELTKEIMQTGVLGAVGTSEDTKFDVIESKAMIQEGDYLENIAFVGETLDGRNVIVIMDNALCTSGFEVDGKNKEEGVFTFTFECHADLTSDLNKLPYHIYYPKATA
jgi:hypothetical protein